MRQAEGIAPVIGYFLNLITLVVMRNDGAEKTSLETADKTIINAPPSRMQCVIGPVSDLQLFPGRHQLRIGSEASDQDLFTVFLVNMKCRLFQMIGTELADFVGPRTK